MRQGEAACHFDTFSLGTLYEANFLDTSLVDKRLCSRTRPVGVIEEPHRLSPAILPP